MSLANKLIQLKEDIEQSEHKQNELHEVIQIMKEESYVLTKELGESQRKYKLKQMELTKAIRLLDGVERRFGGLQENKDAALVANSELKDEEDQRQDLFDEAKFTKDAINDLDCQLKQFESKKKVLLSNIVKAESRVDLTRKKRDSLIDQLEKTTKIIQEADSSSNFDFSEEDMLVKIRELDAEFLRVSTERENFQRTVTSLKAAESKINKQTESVKKELHTIEAEMDGLNSLA